MSAKGKSFSVVRLNDWSENGWGVVDDASGALAHIDGLALKLTEARARTVAAELNAGAEESPDKTVCAHAQEVNRKVSG